jgi:proline racemase
MNAERLRSAWEAWSPPDGAPRILTVDAHTAGEPLRVILSGFGALSGTSILERRRSARERYDHLRTALMWEPRGHADQYGCIVTAPVTEEADFGVLFTHNDGYSTMCGHGIIAVTRVAVEVGLVPATEPLTPVGIDTPAGFVQAYARVDGGTVRSVYFHNVASFVEALDREVQVPGVGLVRYDVAFGGAYYAYVDAASVGVGLAAADHDDLIRVGRAIKRACMDAHPLVHPTDPELGFFYGTIFVGPAHEPEHHSRNVCVFAEGEVDRSPTGTGVSGRLALHHARGEIGTGESLVIESILGTTFTGQVVREFDFHGRGAVIPQVEGQAFVTGRHEFVIDPNDPLGEGFLFR